MTFGQSTDLLRWPRLDHRVAAAPGASHRRSLSARWRGATLDIRRNFTPGRQKSLAAPGGAVQTLLSRAVPSARLSTSSDVGERYVVSDARACTLTQRAPVKSRLPAREGRPNRCEPLSLHQRPGKVLSTTRRGSTLSRTRPLSEERAHLRSRRLDPGPRRPGRSGVDTNASTSAALMLWRALELHTPCHRRNGSDGCHRISRCLR
jgi:hypothetical protein